MSEFATPIVSNATKLRKFLYESDKILACPGVYDGFSARIALQVGFDALYMVHLFLFNLLAISSSYIYIC